MMFDSCHIYTEATFPRTVPELECKSRRTEMFFELVNSTKLGSFERSFVEGLQILIARRSIHQLWR